MVDWNKYRDELIKAGVVADPRSKLAQTGRRVAQDVGWSLGAGLLKPSAETQAVIAPQMGAAPAPTRAGGAQQEVGVGARDVAADAQKPQVLYAPGVSAGGSGAGGGLPSIQDIMNAGGHGSPGGFQRMEAKNVGEAYDKAFDAQTQAIGSETEAGKQAVQAESNAYLGRAAALENARQQAADAEANRQQLIDQHFAESKQLAQNLKDTDLNPDSYYGDGAGGVIKRGLMILASAFGGYAAGLRGGPNTVQESIDRDIDRFVQGQKAEYQKRAGMLQDSNTRFGQLMQRFGDERAAEAAMKADMLGAVEAQGQALMSDAKQGQVSAQGEKALANVAGARAQHEEQVTKYVPPTAGMSPIQAMEIQQRMQAGAANIAKTEAETAELNRRGQGAQGGNPDLELAQNIAGRIGAKDKGASVDIMGVGRVGAGDKYEMWKSNLDDAAALAIKLRGGRVNADSIKAERQTLFGDGNDAAVKAGMAKLQELARIKGGKGGGGAAPAGGAPESFEE